MTSRIRAGPMHDLDATDRAILGALLEDARYSQREIAKQVGVAQGTVTNRLRRLEAFDVKVDEEIRRVLMRCLKPETRTVEGLSGLIDVLGLDGR